MVNDPWVILFHCTDEPIGSYKKSITPHLLNAAKMLIPKYWKQQATPSLRQWLIEVDRIYHMESSTLTLRKKLNWLTKYGPVGSPLSSHQYMQE